MAGLSSPIVDSFQDAVVLITGGTGYIGSGVLEKLLRVTPNIKRIYLLIRPKKNKSIEDRFEELFETRYWETLKNLLPNYKEYVKIIYGDLSEENVGISECDKQEIMAEVTHIFHLAATVRFNEKLKKAVEINVLGTKFILDLALKCLRLKSIVHVSTAYVHCYLPDLTERFYDIETDVDEFLEFCHSKTDEELDSLTPSIIGHYPNTYTFTKGIAEAMIQKYENKLPISIVRPSIVNGSWQEPLPGWVDNLFGPIGIMLGYGMGLTHTMLVDNKKKFDLVPVDMTANCIVAASWKNCNTNYKENPISIFNFVSYKRNPLDWGEYFTYCKNGLYCYGVYAAVWEHFCFMTTNKTVYEILKFLFHTIPGHVADTALQIMGKKPLFVKTYNKINMAQEMTAFFSTRQWAFDDEKTLDLFESLDATDKRLYNFDIAKVNWDLHIVYLVRIVRTHILKDPMSTVNEARKKATKLKIIHYTVVFFFLLILYLIVNYLVKAIFY